MENENSFQADILNLAQSINELSLVFVVQRSEARPSRSSLKDCSKGNTDSFKSNKIHVKSDDQSHYT